MLGEVLDDARDGLLLVDWRARLRARTDAGWAGIVGAAASDDCLLTGKGRTALTALTDDRRRRAALYLCALRDLSLLPSEEWDPFVADGDWRRALDAWYADRISVIDKMQALPGADARTDPGSARQASALRSDIERRYLGGMANGRSRGAYGDPLPPSWLT